MTHALSVDYVKLLKQQTALAKFGEKALVSHHLDDILTEACVLVSAALGTELAKVMELQPDGATLLMRAGVGWRPGLVGKLTLDAVGDTSENFALRTGEPVSSPDISTESRFVYPAFLLDHGVQAVANVAIIGGPGQRPFGILQVDSRTPRLFSTEDTDFLRNYANLLAAAVNRFRLTDELRAAADRLRFALQAGRLGVWELPIESGEIPALDTARWHVGGQPDEAIGIEQLQDAMHDSDRDRLSTDLANSVAGGLPFSGRFRIVRPDQTDGWVHLDAQAELGADGKPVRIVGMSRDVTEQLRTEERVRQSHRVEAVGQLTAGVAHDFNNVLQVMLGAIELALHDETRPEIRLNLESALHAGSLGARLTSHLLSFSRKQMLRPTEFDLAALLSGMSETLARLLGARIKVRVAPAPDLPPAFADASHLESAILNLALNARAAMPQGGDLRLEAAAASGQIVIAVTDTGAGMAADVLARACEPFFSTRGNGSGLGLSMVQGFARQSGGELHIASAVGSGTRIELTLPAAPRPPPNVAEPPSFGGGRVLVVDDDLAVAGLAAAFLRASGYDAVVVASGPAALAELRDRPRFAALVTDYAMPGMNGLELVARARLRYAMLPALIITGSGGVDELTELGAGVTILRKPFSRDELFRQLKSIIDTPPDRLAAPAAP